LLPDKRVDTEGERQKSKAHRYVASPTVSCDTMIDVHNLEMTEILQKHVFVGVVDLFRELSVVQVSKKLYLVNHGALA
jgi:DNA mismatch repair protein Mlh1 C-terminus